MHLTCRFQKGNAPKVYIGCMTYQSLKEQVGPSWETPALPWEDAEAAERRLSSTLVWYSQQEYKDILGGRAICILRDYRVDGPIPSFWRRVITASQFTPLEELVVRLKDFSPDAWPEGASLEKPGWDLRWDFTQTSSSLYDSLFSSYLEKVREILPAHRAVPSRSPGRRGSKGSGPFSPRGR